MIAALLNFIFLILLAVFIVVGIVAYKIYRTVHSVKKQFNSFKGKDNDRATERQQYSRTSTEEEIIIDRRTPDEMNRKIFSKSEGEYVDYEEEK
ncbi:putative uncharacterized protein [Prevotella sp. CAG:1185]|uniref:DUF4834 family protein n=1 Tax=uncultured Prevotella sp. TaxID=159272 RepID=UPI0003407C2C|nr:DUF4834 family protein [uncultured Prevotella sp.]CCY81829.1 putative uncharacterized protein [Prevotella sp. CAG:1185]